MATPVPPRHKVVITPDHQDGLYKTGDKVTYKIEYFRYGKPFAGQELEAVFHHLDYPKKRKNGFRFLSGKKKELSIVLEKEGSTILDIYLIGSNGKPIRRQRRDNSKKTILSSFSCGVLASPEKCLPVKEEPADFEAFWNENRKELAASPLQVLEKVPVDVPAENREGFLAWDMKVNCAGPAPVSGYLTMPKEVAEGKKRVPVLVFFHGGGVRSSVFHFIQNAICFDVNAHGIVNGKDPEYYLSLSRNELLDYIHKGEENRDTYYFRYMYVRILRALEFAKSLPEWNGKDLIIIGGSQGGAQTLIAAGMDPDVTLAHAWVPAICNLNNYDKRFSSSWPCPFYYAEKGEEDREKVAECIPYFDAVNFAKRIHCEIYMAAGLLDATCPPANVFAAWNMIPSGKKSMYTWYNKGHLDAPNAHFAARLEEVLAEAVKEK